MAQMNHFTSCGLDDAAHDIDGRVMPVEQRRSSYHSHFIFGLIDKIFHCGKSTKKPCLLAFLTRISMLPKGLLLAIVVSLNQLRLKKMLVIVVLALKNL
jgi:hypothetical protein